MVLNKKLIFLSYFSKEVITIGCLLVAFYLERVIEKKLTIFLTHCHVGEIFFRFMRGVMQQEQLWG